MQAGVDGRRAADKDLAAVQTKTGGHLLRPDAVVEHVCVGGVVLVVDGGQLCGNDMAGQSALDATLLDGSLLDLGTEAVVETRHAGKDGGTQHL